MRWTSSVSTTTTLTTLSTSTKPISYSSRFQYFFLSFLLYPSSLRSKLRSYFPLYRSKVDLKLLLYSFIYAFLALYISCLAISYADYLHWLNVKNPSYRPLMDPGLTWLNQLANSIGLTSKIADLMVYIALGSIFIRIFSLKKQSITVLRRFLYICTSLYLIRAPTILMTVLPSPYSECPNKRHPNLFIDALLILIQEHAGCGDVFFSGHSIFLNFSARVWLHYSSSKFLPIFITLLSIFGLSSLVFTSFHYSIDVLYATILVNIGFSLYHWIIQKKIGRERWWGKGLCWLDGEALLNELEEQEQEKEKEKETKVFLLPPSSSSSTMEVTLPLDSSSVLVTSSSSSSSSTSSASTSISITQKLTPSPSSTSSEAVKMSTTPSSLPPLNVDMHPMDSTYVLSIPSPSTSSSLHSGVSASSTSKRKLMVTETDQCKIDPDHLA